MPDWKGMRDAVKRACRSGPWSKGVGLARAGAVAVESRADDEWTFRVRLPGDDVAPTVVLLPDDDEWDCDCEGPSDPCEHVAACAIVASQEGAAADEPTGGPTRNGWVRYDLRRTERGLRLERWLVREGGEARRLSGSLGDLLAQEGAEVGFEPTRADVEIDSRLVRRDEPIGVDRAKGLLACLVGVGELRLDGEEVRASAETLSPRARVVDAKGGSVELVLEAHPSVDEVVSPGIVRAGDRLHPLGSGERFGQRWERLPARRTFGREAMGELVGRILPELERHVAVSVQTRRLPGQGAAAAPWVQFEIDPGADGVDVLARLVYGDPPVARVENGRLVHVAGAVPRRDEAEEKKLALRLRAELNLVLDRRVRFAPSEGARLLSDLHAFDDGRAPGLGRSRGLDEGPELVARLRDPVRDGEGTEVVFEVAAGRGAAAEIVAGEAVLSAWAQGLHLVPLGRGGFARVPAGWLERHGHLVADLLAAREQCRGSLPRAALPILGELCDELQVPGPIELTRVRALLDAEPAAVDAVPPGFRGALRPYQREGVAWLARLREAGLGAILADDMGLGKTVQALCVMRGRTLVVCPRSVIHNWVKEVERFRPDLRHALYHGPGRSLADADVTLTTYATLRNDVAILAGVPWDTVVLDEAQAIKNPDSQSARAAYELPAGFRLSLSGTPIENRLDELWSQTHFVNRGLLGGRKDFAERYEKPILAGDRGVTERLRSRLRPFLLRRLKRDVAADLPPRTEAILYCELDADERALYDSVRMASRAEVVRALGEGGNVLAALEVLLRLRQAACHAGLVPGHQADSSSKVEALCEALEDAVADGHKALVFSQWTSFLDRIEPHLRARGIDHTRLDGATRDRGAVVDAFQDPAGPPVLLISLTAGGTGLNLTAADHVFLLDPWWNPAVEEQAADRAHRIGQDRPVMVYRLVAKDTVEERVLDLQASKRRVAEAALEGATLASGAITREEILALLES